MSEAVIRRRFDAGLKNFRDVYRQTVGYWQQRNASGRSWSWTPKEVAGFKEAGIQDSGVEAARPGHAGRASRAHPGASTRSPVAYRTGTGVVVMRDGKVVEIEPDPELYGGFVPTWPLG